MSAVRGKGRKSRRARSSGVDAPAKRAKNKPIEPIDVIDGIPDRTDRPSWWKYAVLVGVFVIWVGFLIACKVIGSL